MTGLANKRLLLGISGGIAAYKTAFLARLLVKAGAEVRVVMTEGAKAFVQPLTFQALTGHPVHDTLLDPEAEAGMGHIELARWADLVLIAPASADLMARLAAGLANDLLTTLCLATTAPVHLAPAMNQAMWQHPATQRNAAQLQQLGYTLIPPAVGEQACGDVGPGRMPEPEALLEWVEAFFQPAEQPASGLCITITAGPTREALDPVRYLSNHSSGKMGYALAATAAKLGARVQLVSGPVELPAPAGVTRIAVNTALDMQAACENLRAETDLFIACAAVADYRAEAIAGQKIKKQGDQDRLTLQLIKNPDILAGMAQGSPRPFCVGFAAETQQVEDYAQDKLRRKQLDAIVANDVSQPGIGFGSDDNRVSLLLRRGDRIETHHLPQNTKQALAHQLLIQLLAFYKESKDS